MSFLKKFQRNRKSSETGSIGSTLSIQSLGINKGSINTTYSINEKELPTFLKAIWRNDIVKVKKLMKKNYSTVDKEQRSGLHLACAMGSLEIAHELLGNYCNELLEKRDNCGRTAVFKAVENGSLSCVRLLIEKGAKLDIRDNLGDTLIHSAIIHKHSEVLQTLLDEPCDSTVLNNEGMGPLHLAASLNYLLGIDMLLSHNVDIDQPNLHGKTALILASESGNLNVVKELLAMNANMSVTDNDGKNAHFYADFHQYNDCAQQLESLSNFNKNKTPPRKPAPLQMPDFIAIKSLEANNSKESLTRSSPKALRRNKKGTLKKRGSQDSIDSCNSWSKDISQYSSETTLPIVKNNHIHDVSTPSSMPNPSKTPASKHISDDEESQWTDSESYVEPHHKESDNKATVPAERIKNDLGVQSRVLPELKPTVVEITKNSDSDWDTDTEIKFPNSEDGHRTDSNIEECYQANYQILNKPVRYDSNEALENSLDYDEDEDIELSQTKIPNPNYRENVSATLSKPPVSPVVKADNIPTITVDDLTIKRKTPKSSSGDNLSYTSTDISSKHESSVCSDNLIELEGKNIKLTEDYIKKCSNMESKLRILESERDNLQRDVKNLNESKRKLESENSRFYKDFQKVEVMLSERKDELDEFKSKFIISEDLLKTREKELFDAKKMNQDLIGNRNEMEMKNIAYNSKINQLLQEITNLQSELQRSHHSDKEVDYQKSQFENERNTWMKNNEDLNVQLGDLRHLLSESQKLSVEQLSSINTKDIEIKDIKKRFDDYKEESQNKDEEIEQLKKTIKNLSADLESSNKSSAIVAKEEQKNKDLKQLLKKEEEKIIILETKIEMLNKQMMEADQSNRQIIEKINKQLAQKEEYIAELNLKCKVNEKQAQDLEKLLQSKSHEIKDLNKKCSDLNEDLTLERERNNKTMEKINAAISSTITQYSSSEEILEPLQYIRKLVNGLDTTDSSINLNSLPKPRDIDSSIELTKARSQIRVLQDQIDNMKKDFIQSQDENVITKKEATLQSKYPVSRSYEIELDRVDIIEKMEKQNQELLNDQSRLLRKNEQQERQKLQLIRDEEKSLTIQLNNSIKSNQALMDIHDSVMHILTKYHKQIGGEGSILTSSSQLDPNSSSDISNLPVLCSKLLQQMTDIIDDMQLKLKRLEIENHILEEEQMSRDKSRCDSKMILTQQLSEMTQMMDNQRNNREKLEKIRDENEFQLRNELYKLRQSNLMEISEMSTIVSRADKDRAELMDEIRTLNDQLMKERQLKDSVTEQLISAMRNSNGSIQQTFGSKEFLFTSPISNIGSSQWNIPSKNGEVDRKPFSTSMSNLSLLKLSVTEDEELRQKMRKELDRSIAKHLESGRPIRQLNVKDKIRSLNIVRYPSSNVAWKTQ